ncbi:MAG: pitrilysin family protein, partial [Deinococcota bacterium]
MTLRCTLPNGLTLLLEPDAEAQTVAAGYFVATGARDERPEELGASHFLEHLMFKGSQRLDAATLNARLDELGGNANAFTSEEATVYHAATLPEQTPELLETLTELLRPALRPVDIEPERGVILEEIAMYAEQPAIRVMDELRATYWGEHPLGHAVLGTPKTVGALTREALVRNWRERYGADRVTLAVVGAFDPDRVLAWAQEELKSWPAGIPQVATASFPPPAPGTVRTLRDDRLTRVQVALALPGLPTNHPLREAAVVLAELIGGENGLLYWALLDTGLADSADLAHLDYRDAGTF